MDLIKKWNEFVLSCNTKGIPIPLLRDPKSSAGSVSLTMMFISFNLVLVGLVGKYSKMLEGVDLGQALNLFTICSALYFGRKLQTSRDPKGVIVADPNEPNQPILPTPPISVDTKSE
jgi:hypothetical protein